MPYIILSVVFNKIKRLINEVLLIIKMEAILDSSFIISCVRKRIDFLEELKNMGFTAVVPREVFQEIKDLRSRNKSSREDRTAIDIAMEMIEKGKVKKVGLGEMRVDDALIKKGKEGIYIATLDRAIKRAVPNKIVILDAKNSLGIERS